MEFDDRRRAKWIAGRKERGLPLDTGTFDGDPAAEAREELLDLANYAETLHAQGRIDANEWHRIYMLALDLDICFARA